MNSVISFARGAQLNTLTVCDCNSLTVKPFIQDILNQFIELDDLAQAILQAAQSHDQVARVLFDIDESHVLDSFSLKEKYLFPQNNPIVSLSYCNSKVAWLLRNDRNDIVSDPSAWRDIHQVLHFCGIGRYSYEDICNQSNDRMKTFLDDLLKTCVVRKQDPPVRKDLPMDPGIVRLQHAALLFRSQTTGLLVDPHLHSNYGLPNLKQDITRAMLEGYVDGILISHNHYDHWHLPTLMQFAADIPIIVPKVPRASITCDDMVARLKEIGFEQVMAVDWYAEPIQIGDISIHVLPFYGEQPLVPQHSTLKHPDLRNWGNTYLLQTEDYSAWLLIDAGVDPMGSMVDVAEYVRQTLGCIDIILSNFQPLSYNSVGTDLSTWGIDIIGTLLSNPKIFSTIGKPDSYHLSTLGPSGVAKICQIVEATACLPYAHSWADLGEWAPDDELLIRETQYELTRQGCHTVVVPWHIGDAYLHKADVEREMKSYPVFY